jgi:hypothetical protein
MWDNAESSSLNLSHDMPCARCGHAMHTYLACSDTCSCEPATMPGTRGSLLTA